MLNNIYVYVFACLSVSLCMFVYVLSMTAIYLLTHHDLLMSIG